MSNHQKLMSLCEYTFNTALSILYQAMRRWSTIVDPENSFPLSFEIQSVYHSYNVLYLLYIYLVINHYYNKFLFSFGVSIYTEKTIICIQNINISYQSTKKAHKNYKNNVKSLNNNFSFKIILSSLYKAIRKQLYFFNTFSSFYTN